jgi:hypothetical protein
MKTNKTIQKGNRGRGLSLDCLPYHEDIANMVRTIPGLRKKERTAMLSVYNIFVEMQREHLCIAKKAGYWADHHIREAVSNRLTPQQIKDWADINL